MKKTLLLALMAIATVGPAEAQKLIHMSFANTSAATVMKVIASRTGTNIIFVGKDTATISIDISVDNAEDAIRAAVSAAGMSYRKVNNAYIVASSDAMKRALEPYSVKVHFPLEENLAQSILKTVQDAYPDAAVSVYGNSLEFFGLTEDAQEAKGLVRELSLRAMEDARELERRKVDDVPITEAIAVVHSNPADVAKALSAIWPDLKVASTSYTQPTGQTQNQDNSQGASGANSQGAGQAAPATVSGGVLTLYGPKGKVELAAAFANKIETTVPAAPETTFRVYPIKYLSASTLLTYINKGGLKNVQGFIAPEDYAPRRAIFNPLTSQLSQGSTSGSTGSTGTSSGTSTGTTSTTGTSSTGSSSGSSMTENPDTPDDRARRLVLFGSTANLDEAVRLLDSIDLKPQQVYVEVKVVETSPTYEDNEGLAYTWSNLSFTETPRGSSIAPGAVSRAPFTFGATIGAMITKGEAKMLANPKVGVVDNAGASLFIGDTINVPTQSSSINGTTLSFVSFPVGIILLIHPHINADGNITMRVNPVISTVTGTNGGFPQTSSREEETTMIVKDGETIVLGGLIQDSFTKSVQELPFLSKLPIIGELFKSSTTNKSRTDVIISITTHIMKDDAPKK